MATTSSEVAYVLLRSMRFLGIPFALLHGADKVESLRVESDIDIITGIDSAHVNRRLRNVAPDFAILMSWQYDRNSFATIWLDTRTLLGAQIDILCDPKGAGVLGVLTEKALREFTDSESELPRLSSEAESLYLLVKSIVKGDSLRYRHIREEIKRNEHSVPFEILNPRVRQKYAKFLQEEQSLVFTRLATRLKGKMGLRTLVRLIKPAGRVFVIDSQESTPCVAYKLGSLSRLTNTKFVGYNLFQICWSTLMVRRPVVYVLVRNRFSPISVVDQFVSKLADVQED